MKKIGETNEKLFGDYAIIVSGFDKDEQEKLLILAEESFNGLKVIFADERDMENTLKDIFSLNHKHGFGVLSNITKAIIMSGFLEKRLIEFMKVLKSKDLVPRLFAVLTPTSSSWKLSDLLVELEKEKEEIAKMKKKNTNNKI